MTKIGSLDFFFIQRILICFLLLLLGIYIYSALMMIIIIIEIEFFLLSSIFIYLLNLYCSRATKQTNFFNHFFLSLSFSLSPNQNQTKLKKLIGIYLFQIVSARRPIYIYCAIKSFFKGIYDVCYVGRGLILLSNIVDV